MSAATSRRRRCSCTAPFYRAREDAGAVVHLHSTHGDRGRLPAGCRCRQSDPAADALFRHARRPAACRLSQYYRPGDPAMEPAIHAAARDARAVLLANHGPVVSGKTLTDAVYAAEELEEAAKLYLLLRGTTPRLLTPRAGGRPAGDLRVIDGGEAPPSSVCSLRHARHERPACAGRDVESKEGRRLAPSAASRPGLTASSRARRGFSSSTPSRSRHRFRCRSRCCRSLLASACLRAAAFLRPCAFLRPAAFFAPAFFAPAFFATALRRSLLRRGLAPAAFLRAAVLRAAAFFGAAFLRPACLLRCGLLLAAGTHRHRLCARLLGGRVFVVAHL